MANEQAVFGLTGQSIAKIRRGLNKLNRLPGNLRVPGLPGFDEKESKKDTRIHFHNTASETVPAFGVMAVTDRDLSGKRIIYETAKPTITFYRHYIVNGPIDVEADKYGVAQPGPLVRVLYDEADPEPAADEGWGPRPDEWFLGQFYPETALVVGDYDPDDDDDFTLVAHWKPITEIIGKTDSTISKGNTGQVNVYAGQRLSEFDIGLPLLDVANRWADVGSGKWVVARWINGQPYLEVSECPAT